MKPDTAIHISQKLRSDDSTEPGPADRFTPWQLVALGTLVVLIFLPALFYHFDSDAATFFISGRRMLHGDIQYRDFVEIKPPLIHLIYAAGSLLFGTGEIAMRAFDLLLQSVTCGMLFLLIRRASGSDRWGAVAVISYAMLYVGLANDSTMQPESYVGLFGIPVLLLLIGRRTWPRLFLIGVLCGLLTLLKFPLGILLLPAILSGPLIFREPPRRWLRDGAVMTAGTLAVGIAFIGWLAAFHALDDFMTMSRFTRGYVALQWSTGGGWIKSMLKDLPTIFSDFYSLAFSLATLAAIAMTVPTKRGGENDRTTPGARQLLRICSLTFIAMVVSMMSEGTVNVYRLSRVYPFGVILCGFALALLPDLGWTRIFRDRYGKALVPVIIIGAVLFSPIPRYLSHSVPVWKAAVTEKKIDGSHGDASKHVRKELLQIGDYVERARRPEDRMFAASVYTGLLYYYSGYVPDFKLFFSPSIVSPFAPIEWRESSRKYLLDRRPRFIVIQQHDSIPQIAGTPLSSAEAMESLPGIDSLLRSDYTVTLRTPSFNVYQRIDPASH